MSAETPEISPSFVSRRAICPFCGSAVALAGSKAEVVCEFCGCASVVERRLRRLDPDAGPRASVEIDWTPAHLNPGAKSERAVCPGCGADLPIEGMQAVVHCETCGTECKIERRTRLLPRHVEVEGDDDPATVGLIAQLGDRSTDLADRVALAKRIFDTWGRINRTLARHAASIMRIMRDDDRRLANAIGDCIGKLLCQGDVALQNAVLAVADPFLQDPRSPCRLYFEISLGPTICLKALLDAAQVLWRKGAHALCCQALLGGNTLIGRNLGDKARIAEIILYRIPYLEGPCLAWALECIQGGHPLPYRVEPETLLRLMDDCAFERPELIPELAAGINLNAEELDAKAYRRRLALWDELASVEAKEVLLHKLPAPPPGLPLRAVDAAVDRLVACLDEPRFAEAATGALVRLVERTVPARIHALVKERGDALPEDVRRAYVKHVPDTPHLSELPVKYWQSTPPREKAPAIVECERLLKEGIDAAIALDRAERDALSAYWRVIKQRTPLMAAAGRGDLDEVGKLLVAGAEVDETNAPGWTALLFAAERGHADIVSALLAAGARPDHADDAGVTAAGLAAAAGRDDVLRVLPTDLDEDQQGEALAAAIAAGRVDTVRVVLELGADPDLLDEKGRTPLMHAIRAGDVALAAALLDGGARLDHGDADGFTALHHAVDAGRADAVAELIARGADPDLPAHDGASALILAARRGDAAAASHLAPASKNKNARDGEGKTALGEALARGDADIVATLRVSGASEAANPALLFAAIRSRDADQVEELLAAGIDPNTVDGEGTPAIYHAVNYGTAELVRILLARGADPNARDADGRTAIMRGWAARGDVVQQLIAAGADVDAADDRGQTLLMTAAAKGHKDLITLLVRHGADPRRTDRRGHDAFEHARIRRGWEEVVAHLRELTGDEDAS